MPPFSRLLGNKSARGSAEDVGRSRRRWALIVDIALVFAIALLVVTDDTAASSRWR